MDVDLSHKSICELHFDSAEASPEERLVASRVGALTACNNLIERVVGLRNLFHRLTRLDLAHNKLGSSKTEHGTSAWLSELPASLRVLNLAHNGLQGFYTHEKIENAENSQSANALQLAIMHLRRSCPLALALFFNRNQFPHLDELDLSHNALHLSPEESDRVEEMWQVTLGSSSTAAECTPGNDGYEAWMRYTTCAVTVLRLDSNKELSALNGLLCGMDEVLHLHAADCGVKDLTAVSGAATFCPKLVSLDMRNCPIVHIFVQASRSTIMNFVQLLLLPSLLLEGKSGGEERQKKEVDEEEKKRLAEVEHILREVVHLHLDCIENTVLRHQGCGGGGGGLQEALFAALLQQVIPQVSEVNGDVDVEAVRRGFMDGAREAIQQFIEKNNKADVRHNGAISSYDMLTQAQPSSQDEVVVQRQEVEELMLKASRNGVPALSTSLVDTSVECDTVDWRETAAPPEATGHCSSPLPPTPAVAAGVASYTENPSALLPSSDSSVVLSTGPNRRDRSRSALRVSMAASAAATQLRPAVLVRSTADTTVSTDDSTYGVDSGMCEAAIAKPMKTVTVNFLNKNTSASANSRSAMIPDDSSSGAVCSERSRGVSLSTTSLSAAATAPAQVGENNSSSEDAGGGGRRFQRALAALTPLLRQRLRAEGVSVVGHTDKCHIQSLRDGHDEHSNSMTTSTSSLTLTTTASSTREALMQQAQALEEALLASHDRQRNLQEVVMQLKEQLRQDRRLIIDQRKEAAQLRQERDLLTVANTQTKRKLRKRQKEIAYGAAALQRREAESQRRAALEHLAQEEKLLIGAEKALREKAALSASCAFSRQMHLSQRTGAITGASSWMTEQQQQPLRMTRGDVLRDNAVRERMRAMQRKEPLAYSARKFRPSEYSSTGVDESGSFITNSTTAAAMLQLQHLFKLESGALNGSKCGAVGCAQEDDRVHGKTPWRRERSASVSSHREAANRPESLYEKGYSPYCDDKPDTWKKGNEEEDDGHQFPRELSLQQLFEEAAAVRQQQQLLQQKMCDVRGGKNVSAEQCDKFEKPCATHSFATCSDAIGAAIERCTPSTTCTGTLQGRPKPASCSSAIGISCHVPNNVSLNDVGNSDDDCDDKIGVDGSGDNHHHHDDDDDDESVDVVVSVEKTATKGDFHIAAAHPLLGDGGMRTTSQKQRLVQPQDDESAVSFPPPLPSFLPPTSAEHLSVDARSIYAEIVRQRQQQLESKQPMGAQQFGQSSFDHVKELSPVPGAVKGAQTSETKRPRGEKADISAKSEKRDKNSDDVEDTTCRALFV